MKLRILICVVILFINVFIYAENSGFKNFITRNQDKLMDGSQEFRFMSFCIPELGMQENPYWGINDPFAQEDAIKTIAILGGQVTRCYVFSVRTENKSLAHITAPGEYNEECFKSFDNLLKLCNQYKVRLIIPFIDTWSWWGGITEFSKMRNKDKSEFWNDPQLKQDYKDLITYVLNRKNTITGVLYKDDPAVLAWETGNELRNGTSQWAVEMAAFIKSVDKNHLVIDGRDDVHFQQSVDDPNIDIITSHYYGSDFVKRFQSDYKALQGKKPFIIGEFGLVPDSEIEGLLNAIVESKASGGLIWSLRQHDQYGGFRWHNEGETKYYAYHFPGFPQGESYSEEFVVDMIRNAAYKIRGMTLPALLPPDTAPVLLSIESVSDIRWKGVAGATGYDVERAENINGKWLVVGKNISDSVFDSNFVKQINIIDPYDKSSKTINVRILFQDHYAVDGKTYFYRVKARNAGGESKYSNVEKIINAKDEYGIIIDQLDNLSMIYAKSKNIIIDKEYPGYYELDQSRIRSNVNSKEFIIYKTKRNITSFQVTGFSENLKCLLDIYGSANGKDYQKLDTEYFNIKLEKGKNYKYIFQGKSMLADVRYLKIEIAPIPDAKATDIEIGTVKIGYGTMKIVRIEPPKIFASEGSFMIDDFEGYKGDSSKLTNTYMPSQNGGKLILALDNSKKENGKNGLKFEYDFNGKGYAGVNRLLKDANWTGNDMLSFWILPDGSKNRLVLQFQEMNGEYWEYSSDALSGISPQIIKMKLADFKQPSWGGKVDGKLDLSQIKEFSMYINKDDNSKIEKSTLYFDNIQIMADRK